MPVEILPNIYKIAVPLPDHALRSVNSYVILSDDRNLVIDTGWNRIACLEALLQGLEALGADRSRTDLFLTHLHADHAGLAGLFADKGVNIYCSGEDYSAATHFINIGKDKVWPELRHLAEPHGFPPAELTAGLEEHAGNRYAPDRLDQITLMKNGDLLTYGAYQFRCLSTPGHTRGHMALYNVDSQLLFSGDHLLGRFFPTLSQWDINSGNLERYLKSLDELETLPVKLVLPGHWDAFSNYQARIAATKRAHQKRNEEILALFAAKPRLTTYQTASLLQWNHAWVFFPLPRKWSATADTLAHLCYLRDQGILLMERCENTIFWQLA